MCGSAWFGANHVVIDSKSYISNDNPDWNENSEILLPLFLPELLVADV